MNKTGKRLKWENRPGRYKLRSGFILVQISESSNSDSVFMYAPGVSKEFPTLDEAKEWLRTEYVRQLRQIADEIEESEG